MINLENFDIPFRSIVILLFTVLLSSCLKETAVPIESAFSIESSEDKTSPVTIQLKNESYGADEYEWTFEGGTPSSSNERTPAKVVFSIALNDIAPGVVSITNKSKGGSKYEWTFEGGVPSTSSKRFPEAITFAEGGEHKIRLRVFNGSKYEELTKTFTLRPSMQVDFSYKPSPVDQDWEAPLTLTTTNLTTGGLSYRWICNGAQVLSPTKQTTSVRFEHPGIYKLQLIAGNGKEEKTKEKTITIKPNTGIIKQNDVRFGINEAKNSIGCFYSAKFGGVLTSNQIAQDKSGVWVDFGFFALNSSFNYCYFFAPNQAKNNSFPEIDHAQGATFVNTPGAMGININDAVFENIKRASDLNQFAKWSEMTQTSFSKSNVSHFVLVCTADGRKGVIRVKKFVKDGVRSYIVADVILEKRTGE